MTRTAHRSALILALLALAGCKSDPTELIVTIAGDTGFSEVAIEVDGDEVARSTLPLTDGRDLPLTLTLVHGGGDLGPLRVGGIAYAASGAEQARACVHTQFLRGSSASVSLTLNGGVFVPCTAPLPDDGGTPGCDPAACEAIDPAAVCVDDVCVVTACTGARRDCDPDIPGCDTNTNSNPLHCGGCNMPCPPGQSCMGGNCR